MSRRLTYPLVGTFLAIGAPAGLLLLQALNARIAPTPTWLAREITSERLVYFYLMVSTVLVFTSIGYVLGRKEDLLHALSTTDPLTGLFNRRFLQTETERELARANRYAGPLALLLIDVDRLKLINDQLGHHAGDHALLAVSKAIHENLRIHDVAARYGGDEFAVLCPQTGGLDAQTLAERIREAVQNSAGQGRTLSVSIGVEVFERGLGLPAEQLFARADRALYAAKEAGRNRTGLAKSTPPS